MEVSSPCQGYRRLMVPSGLFSPGLGFLLGLSLSSDKYLLTPSPRENIGWYLGIRKTALISS